MNHDRDSSPVVQHLASLVFAMLAFVLLPGPRLLFLMVLAHTLLGNFTGENIFAKSL